jgi:hypothetical protein
MKAMRLKRRSFEGVISGLTFAINGSGNEGMGGMQWRGWLQTSKG